MFCRKCGTQIDGNVSFCPKCGTKTEVDSGASQEFRTYAPMWSRQEDAAAQKPVEPDNEPEKKKNDKKGLIIGVAIGLVVAAIAVVVTLFVTGVISGNGEGSSGESDDTTVSADSDGGIVMDSSGNVKYKVLNIEDAETWTVDMQTLEPSSEESEYVDYKAQIPYLKEFEFLGIDFDSIEVNGSECYIFENVTSLQLYFYENGEYLFFMAIAYKGDSLNYENIIHIAIDSDLAEVDGQERWVDCSYESPDNVIYTTFGADGEYVDCYTRSGYQYADGLFYDDNGNEISEMDFWDEAFRLDQEEQDKYF